MNDPNNTYKGDMMPDNDDDATPRGAVKQVLYPQGARVQAELQPWVKSIKRHALLGKFGAALKLSGKATDAMNLTEANAAGNLWGRVRIPLRLVSSEKSCLCVEFTATVSSTSTRLFFYGNAAPLH